MSEATCLAAGRLELYKCCATKSERRPAEFPVELQSEKNINRWAVHVHYNELCTYILSSIISLLEWCKEGMKTVFYRVRCEGGAGEPAGPALSHPEHNYSVPRAEPASVEEDIMDTA